MSLKKCEGALCTQNWAEPKFYSEMAGLHLAYSGHAANLIVSRQW